MRSITRATRRMEAVQSPIILIVGELVRRHPGTISLGQGVVHYAPPAEALEAVADFLRTPTNHRYGPVDGIGELLDALRVKLEHENEIVIGSERRIFVTAGGNMAFMHAVLAELEAISSRCEIYPADGALFVLLRLDTELSAMTVVERLVREHGVAVIPGTTFGLSDGCYLRMSFGALERSTVATGIGRLVRGLRAIPPG